MITVRNDLFMTIFFFDKFTTTQFIGGGRRGCGQRGGGGGCGERTRAKKEG